MEALHRQRTSQQTQYIYSIRAKTRFIYATSLLTRKTRKLIIPLPAINQSCSWTVIPSGRVFFTGGLKPVFNWGYLSKTSSNECFVIDSNRDYALATKREMLTPRSFHVSTYHRGFVYALGGRNISGYLKECERYSIENDEWSSIPTHHQPVIISGVVVLEHTIYIIVLQYPDYIIQTLNLEVEEIGWKTLNFKLPFSFDDLLVAKLSENECYFAINSSLYTFNSETSKVSFEKHFNQPNSTTFSGPSYYSKGTFYCATEDGQAIKIRT